MGIGMTTTKRPEFTREQEDWLCYVLDDWYLEWKSKMTDNGEPHMLGIAKEQFKNTLCGMPVDTLLEDLIRMEPI